MQENEFEQLINLDEGSKLEFKKSLSDSDRICQTICGFANAGGGRVIFGIHKQGRTPILAGIDNIDNAHRELQNRIFAGCRPEPHNIHEDIGFKGKQFIILTVHALPLSEVCTYKRHTWVRRGSVNIELSGAELVTFLKERGMLSFEEMPSGASIKELDNKKIRKAVISKGSKPTDHDPINLQTLLESLGVATSINTFSLKKSALLFFAKDISKYQRNCEVRIVKFKGIEAELDKKEKDIKLSNTIPELIRFTFDALQKQIGTISVIQDGQRKEKAVIPPEVIREAITNAIGHRDYIDPNSILIEIFDDRIQITNPGGLLPGQTLKNFAETRRHRNPIIHRLLNDFGWGEGLYFGIKTIYKLQRQNHLPDPIFQDLGGFFRIILYTSRSDKQRKPYSQVTERQALAIAFLETHKKIRTSEFAKIAGISSVTAVKDLNELVIQGKLRKIGKFRGVYYIIND